VPVDSVEARKTATGHSCKPLVASVWDSANIKRQ